MVRPEATRKAGIKPRSSAAEADASLLSQRGGPRFGGWFLVTNTDHGDDDDDGDDDRLQQISPRPCWKSEFPECHKMQQQQSACA